YDSSNQLQVVYGCSLDSEGNIVTPPTINFYVDGVYHSSITKAGTSYTVQESDMPLDYESCCGYFLDEGLTTTIKNNTIDLSNGDINLYTKTANCPSDYFTYNLDSTTNTYWITPKRSGQGGSNDFISKTKRMTVTATNHYVIPKEYLGLPIVEVKGGPAEVTLPTYSSVTLCDNITSIGDYAFNRAGTLNAVNVHDGITNIGVSAFYSCRLLSGRLIIPNSVTSIGGSAFSFCSGLTSVTIPDSVTSIGDSVFLSCSGLTSVTIGNGVTSIGNSAFSHCSGLTSVIIPDSVTSIGDHAFYSCSGLTSVYIPSTVTTITASSYSNAPFYGCSSSLVIYTDVANASSKPSGWSTYWNYKSSSATYTTNYGYTLEQYKSAVGLEFAPNGDNSSGEEVETIENANSYKIDNSYLEEIILDKKEYIVLPKRLEVA
ncbi:MAG: leucine-rich repeat domain-containing protein, partial [Clostridia bacterium]|nr:leucine-rich repeat domain-containing protein [Clostridia bacterium]